MSMTTRQRPGPYPTPNHRTGWQGMKGRVTMPPASLIIPLQEHLAHVKRVHAPDVTQGVWQGCQDYHGVSTCAESRWASRAQAPGLEVWDVTLMCCAGGWSIIETQFVPGPHDRLWKDDA